MDITIYGYGHHHWLINMNISKKKKTTHPMVDGHSLPSLGGSEPTSLGSSSEEGQGTQGLFQNVVEGWIGVLGICRVSVYP